MVRSIPWLLALGLLLPASLAPVLADVEPEERDRALRAARAVLPDGAAAAAELASGAPEEFDSERGVVPFVEIEYVPSSGSTGKTRKFWGTDERGEEWKIKYGSPEVYTEVAATRLLRAMGYAADFVYPVDRLLCAGCRDDDPWKSMESSGAEPVPARRIPFEEVSMERSFHHVVPGTKRIESHDDQGVRLDELDIVIEAIREAEPDRAAELDSLKAVAFLLQNGDTKPDNQRLVGLSDGTTVLMFQDVGATFGRGKDRISRVVSKLDFRRWRKRLENPWVDEVTLTLRLPRGMHAEGGWQDPVISPEGLRFFLQRAKGLTEADLVEIFRVARFPEATGIEAEEWAAAWQRGIQELSARAGR